MENQTNSQKNDNVEAITLEASKVTETFGGLAKKLAKDSASFAIGACILPGFVIGTTIAGSALALEHKTLMGTICGMSMWGLLYMDGVIQSYQGFIDYSREEIKEDYSNIRNYLSRD